jgi:ABC-type Fe3+/spermidine/putrescine transport system ATPase subunit
MNEGKFLQVGPPDEIYEIPRTMFVASFMGASNIFLGKVVSRKDAKIELEAKNGARIFAKAPEDMRDDEIAGFSIHPELIRIGPAEADKNLLDSQEHTAFHGRIKEVYYQGDFSELTVLIDKNDMVLTVHLSRGTGIETKLSEGSEVIASWDYRFNNILAG